VSVGESSADLAILGDAFSRRSLARRASTLARVHLAQLNIAKLVDDPDSPTVAEFMAALPAINLLGESSPGFVWRLADENGPGAIDQRFPGHEDDPRLIVNMTVWEDFASLRHFVSRSGHAIYLRRRLEWFEKSGVAKNVLWWIEDGHRPTLDEAADRLATLRANGATEGAFDMATPFPEPVSS